MPSTEGHFFPFFQMLSIASQQNVGVRVQGYYFRRFSSLAKEWAYVSKKICSDFCGFSADGMLEFLFPVEDIFRSHFD